MRTGSCIATFKNITFIGMLIANATFAIGSSPTYVGNRTVGVISDGGSKCMDGSWCAVGANMTLTSISAYFTKAGTGAIQFAVYSDRSGVPSTLLGTTAARTNTGTGWQTFSLKSSVPVTSGSKCWLLWNSAASGYTVASTTSTGGSDEWYKSQAYGAWPTSAGTGSISHGFSYSIYATGSGNAATVASTVTSVAISPSSLSLNTGTQKQFATTVTGTGSYSSGITWSAQRGSITSTGLYTAPSTSGSDTVYAVSLQDSRKTATAGVTVTVSSGINSVAVSPTACTLSAGAQKQFAATVTGTGSYSSGVTWSAQRGSVTGAGLYTAPSTGGSDVVTATSAQDSSRAASANVTATVSSAITSVVVSPTASTLNAGAQKQFTATVAGTGSYSSGVTWSAQRGSITSTGLYTAPSSDGSDWITIASAQDSSKTATANVTVGTASYVPIGPLAAFPGAEGMAAGATGGRGGVVYTVNSLDDVYSEGIKHPTPNNGANGPTCSLRDALQASGPRTVVFSVSGTITLHGPIYPVPGDLTIAGQTSPGGIQIKGDGTFGTGGSMIHFTDDNVIMRYMRIRPGNAPINAAGQGLSGIGGGNVAGITNHMFDHCSFEWSGNKPVAWGGITNKVTLSWNLMAEGTHTGVLFNGVTDGQTGLDSSSFDAHHNVLAMFDHRLPYANHKYMRWINNLNFGYTYAGLVRGNVHFDMVGNVFDGISSRVSDDPNRQEIRWADTVAHNEGQLVPGGDAAQFYMANNFGPHNPDGSLDNFSTMLRIAANENGQLNNNVVDSKYKSASPTSMLATLNEHPISISTLGSYTELRSILCPSAGAGQRLDATGAMVSNRDSLDAKVINYILNPSTSPSTMVPDNGTYEGTYPTLSGGSYPTCSMNDGIPDSWKTSHGLSISDSSVANTIRPNANGFTILDLYLSGLFPSGTALP